MAVLIIGGLAALAKLTSLLSCTGYAACVWDNHLGLYHVRNRVYDPYHGARRGRVGVAGGAGRARESSRPPRAGPYTPFNMAEESPRKSAPSLDVVEPIGDRVLIRKDADKKQTKQGIHLPDKIEIPTITGRVVAISAKVDRDENYPIKKYDKVLFNPKHAVPVEFEGDNRLYVIPVDDVVAVFRKSEE